MIDESQVAEPEATESLSESFAKTMRGSYHNHPRIKPQDFIYKKNLRNPDPLSKPVLPDLKDLNFDALLKQSKQSQILFPLRNVGPNLAELLKVVLKPASPKPPDSAFDAALQKIAQNHFERRTKAVYEMQPAPPEAPPEKLPGRPTPMLLNYKVVPAPPWTPGLLSDPFSARVNPHSQTGMINVAGKNEEPVYVKAPNAERVSSAFKI